MWIRKYLHDYVGISDERTCIECRIGVISYSIIDTMFMILDVTCVIVSLILFERQLLGYSMINNFNISVTSRRLVFKHASKYLVMSMFSSCCEAYAHTMVHKLTKSVHKWCLTLKQSRISSSCILKTKKPMTLASSVSNQNMKNNSVMMWNLIL